MYIQLEDLIQSSKDFFLDVIEHYSLLHFFEEKYLLSDIIKELLS